VWKGVAGEKPIRSFAEGREFCWMMTSSPACVGRGDHGGETLRGVGVVAGDDRHSCLNGKGGG
jgi:hypothetical protein